MKFHPSIPWIQGYTITSCATPPIYGEKWAPGSLVSRRGYGGAATKMEKILWRLVMRLLKDRIPKKDITAEELEITGET